MFFRDCYQDIKNHTPFSQQEYLFKTDGIDNEFVLSTTPPEDCVFYVGYTSDLSVAYVEITDFTYDLNSNTITINIDLPENNYVYISGYVIGSFNVDLEADEQDILSESMLIPYQKEQQNRNSLMTYMVTGAQQKANSQAEHIKQLNNVVSYQENKVEEMIIKYSFRANPENLSRLGVRT
jgi:hypothetical protein